MVIITLSDSFQDENDQVPILWLRRHHSISKNKPHVTVCNKSEVPWEMQAYNRVTITAA